MSTLSSTSRIPAALPTSTLASTVAAPSTTGCPLNTLPGIPFTNSDVCGVGLNYTDYTASNATSVMRECCGEAPLIILDGGCGIACNASPTTKDCLFDKLGHGQCNGAAQAASGSPTTDAAAGSTSTGAAPRTAPPANFKGGIFVIGMLAMAFVSGALLV